jgi:hypothetical protein
VYIGLKIVFSYWHDYSLTNLEIVVYDDAYKNNYKNKLCGLCGKFNDNPGDDFTSSAGVIEASVTPFANSWLFVDPNFQ